MTTKCERVPGVSIVTIALNAAAALPLTLESVIAQDHSNIEIIVVDGASWDTTSNTLRRYESAVDRIVVAEDAGIYHAMNDSLAYATKDYIIFMNAGDQFYCSDAVSRIINARQDDPDVLYGDHIYVDRRQELFKRAVPFELLIDPLVSGDIDIAWIDRIPCHQATFFRTDLLRQLRFDTRLQVTADHDVLFRAYAVGARMQYVDEIVCHYFGGGLSAVAGERTRLEGASVYRRYSKRPDLIDRVMYPAGASPFAPHTRRTGVMLGGFKTESLLSRAGDKNWVAARGGELLTPDRESIGLRLSGFCEQDLSVSIVLDGAIVAEASVPKGSFDTYVFFASAVPPARILQLAPADPQSTDEPSDARESFSLDTFQFLHTDVDLPRPIAPGARVRCGAEKTDLVPLLGSGWGGPESTHIWSIGLRSDLWLRLTEEAVSLRLVLDGSPFAPGGFQRVAVYLNGDWVAEIEIAHGKNDVLALDCRHMKWRRDVVNRLTLCPSTAVSPPPEVAETRELGFRLWRIEVD